MLPPIPAWEGLHPLIIHIPIGLFLVAPLFVLLAALLPAKGRSFAIAALILLLIGTASAFVAVASGKAAGELVERTPEISAILERHEDLAETTRNVFAILAVLYLAALAGPRLVKKPLGNRAFATVQVVFVIALAGAALLLTNAAHQGGRLVHEFGVRSVVAGSPEAPATPGAPAADRE